MAKRAKINLFQDPRNLEVEESHRLLAKKLIEENSGRLAVRYVRSESSCGWTRDAKDRPKFVADIGAPTGCLVAFELDGEVRIGWSNKNSDEKTPSTRKGALYTAVLRALADEVLEVSPKTHQAGNDTYLPKVISREMPSFLKRVEKYLKRLPVNYIVPGKEAVAGA